MLSVNVYPSDTSFGLYDQINMEFRDKTRICTIPFVPPVGASRFSSSILSALPFSPNNYPIVALPSTIASSCVTNEGAVREIKGCHCHTLRISMGFRIFEYADASQLSLHLLHH